MCHTEHTDIPLMAYKRRMMEMQPIRYGAQNVCPENPDHILLDAMNRNDVQSVILLLVSRCQTRIAFLCWDETRVICDGSMRASNYTQLTQPSQYPGFVHQLMHFDEQTTVQVGIAYHPDPVQNHSHYKLYER